MASTAHAHAPEPDVAGVDAVPAADMDAQLESGAFPLTIILPEGLGVIVQDSVPIDDAYVGIRMYLSEHPSSFMYTSFHLEMELPVAAPDAFKGTDVEAALLKLGSVEHVAHSGNTRRVMSLYEIMPDIMPILPLLRHPKEASSTASAPGTMATVRMILDPYDVRRVRMHVRRFRDALVHPPVGPVIMSPMWSDAGVQDAEQRAAVTMPGAVDVAATAGKAAPGSRAAPGSGGSGGEEEQGEEGADAAGEAHDGAPPANSTELFLEQIMNDSVSEMGLVAAVQAQRSAVITAQRRVASVPIPIPCDLSSFYPLVLPTRVMDEVALALREPQAASTPFFRMDADGLWHIDESVPSKLTPEENAALLAGPLARPDADTLAAHSLQCVSSVTYSGWNPPPAGRRMLGDLLYLRIEVLEGRVYHVTATPSGFFVNRTTDPAPGQPADAGVFDPRPAASPCSSRTLWTLVSRISPLFRKNYQLLLNFAANNVNEAIAHSVSSWDAAFVLSLGHTPPSMTGPPSAARGLPPSVSEAAIAAGLTLPILTLPLTNTSTSSADLSNGFVSVPASMYGIALRPPGCFAFSRSPWLVPTSMIYVAPDAAADDASSSKAKGATENATSSSAAASPAATSTSCRHTFDVARMEADMMCTFGMNDRGSQRDWNEEWQACHDLPADTVAERVLRTRASVKVLTDFVEAAAHGVMAIAQGHVAALNPTENARAHVYVFNNMFFSMAMMSDMDDVHRLTPPSDAAHATSGAPAASPAAAAYAAATWTEDLACMVSPTHDLRGVMALERANVPGLHTLATVLVTYGGARYIAQSIIPGILQAEVSSKLVYGSVDNGNTVAADADMLAKVQRALAGMHVAERVVTPLAALSGGAGAGSGAGSGSGSAMSDNAAGGGAGDAGDAADAAPTSDAATVVATATATAAGGADGLTRRGLCHRSCATAQPVRYIGPIEWKGVQGSDGRQYLLDIVRLTPRDPAYYDNRLHDMLRMMGKPVAKTPAETAAQFDAYAPEAEPLFRSVFENPYAALLRPELLHLYEMYIQNKAATGAATGADKAAAAAAATAATAVTVPPSMPAADETARVDGEDGSGSGAAPSAQPQLRLNVNVFTRFMRTAEREEREADEAAVRAVSQYLLRGVIPHVFMEMQTMPTVPADGEELTRMLHSTGVNVRYLGVLADMAAAVEARGGACPPFVLEMLETEMVARVARRIFESLVLKDANSKCAPAVLVSAFLNALLGAPSPAPASTPASASASAPAPSAAAAVSAAAPSSGGGGGGKKKRRGGGGASSSHAAGSGDGAPAGDAAGEAAGGGAAGAPGTGLLYAPHVRVSFPSNDVPSAADGTLKMLRELGFGHAWLWNAIREATATHFRYQLRLWKDGGFDVSTPGRVTSAHLDRTPRFILLRRVCQRVGIQVAARNYAWPTAAAFTAPTSSEEWACAARAAACAPFCPADVAGMVPVIKSCLPANLCQDAAEYVTRAREVMTSQPYEALQLLQEAVIMLYHTTGAAHRDVAYCCQTAAAVFAHIGETVAAVLQQQRSVMLYEHTLGADHPETAWAHSVLASYLSAAGVPNAAVRHMARSVYLTQLISPPSHPDVTSGYASLAIIYHSHQHLNMAISCFYEGVKCKWDPVQQASYMHALALAFAAVGNFREAVKWEYRAWVFYSERYGAEHAVTKEAHFFVNIFTKKAVDLELCAKTFREVYLRAAEVMSPAELASAFSSWPSASSKAMITAAMMDAAAGNAGAAAAAAAAPSAASATAPAARPTHSAPASGTSARTPSVMAQARAYQAAAAAAAAAAASAGSSGSSATLPDANAFFAALESLDVDSLVASLRSATLKAAGASTAGASSSTTSTPSSASATASGASGVSGVSSGASSASAAAAGSSGKGAGRRTKGSSRK